MVANIDMSQPDYSRVSLYRTEQQRAETNPLSSQLSKLYDWKRIRDEHKRKYNDEVAKRILERRSRLQPLKAEVSPLNERPKSLLKARLQKLHMGLSMKMNQRNDIKFGTQEISCTLRDIKKRAASSKIEMISGRNDC